MQDRRYTLLRADRLLDGSGAAALEKAALLIDGASVAAVGRQADVRAPEGAAVAEVDYGDATILPGLVDSHTHLVSPGNGTRGDDVAMEDDGILLLRAAANARAILHSGVTTVRDNGAKNRVAFSLREGLQRGLAAGPRMSVCGRPVTITGGHMWYFGSEADGVDGVRSEVRKLIKEGADYIKIVATGGSTRTSFPNLPSYTVDELRAITSEAQTFGKLTAAHCASAQGIANCLEAGVDMIIHCVFADAEGHYSFRHDLAERIVEANAWVNPTLHNARATVFALEEKRRREGGLSPADELLLELRERNLEQRLDTTRRLLAMGARVTAGSDSPWGDYTAGRFVHELELLADAGLSNSRTIAAGTSDSAASIGVGDMAGRLEPGRPADVLVVKGDPVRDLKALWNVRDVYLNGERVERNAPVVR